MLCDTLDCGMFRQLSARSRPTDYSEARMTNHCYSPFIAAFAMCASMVASSERLQGDESTRVPERSAERLSVQQRFQELHHARDVSYAYSASRVIAALAQSENGLSSFLPEDRKVLHSVVDLDRRAIQRQAAEPLVREMCNQSFDQFAAARLLDQVEHVQRASVDVAVNRLLGDLSLDGNERIRRLADGHRTYRVPDWSGVAVELPGFVQLAVGNACRKYKVLTNTEQLKNKRS